MECTEKIKTERYTVKVMMNKKDFIEVLAKKMDKTQKDTQEVVDTVVETLKEEVLRTGGVKLAGFGTFAVTKRAARKGRNPQTGEEIPLPETHVIRFRVAEKFKNAAKDYVN